jgi:hypothetical protein
MAFTIKVNGQTYGPGVGGDMPLLWVLRNPRLETVVIPISDVRNSARAAMVRLAVAAALVATANFQVRAQNCPPGYKIAAGACVQVCPGGYEDTGRVCVYRRQGGGNGS